MLSGDNSSPDPGSGELIRDHSMIIHAQNGFIGIGSHLGIQIDIKKQ